MSDLTQSQQEEEARKPDSILTDNGQEYIYGSHAHSEAFRQQEEELLHLKRIKNPLALRILCLLGVLFFLIFAFTATLWLVAMAALALLFLLQNEKFNRAAYRFLKLLKNLFVITFGLLVALFSPTLGFGLLILYFTLKGEAKDRDLLRRMLKRFL